MASRSFRKPVEVKFLVMKRNADLVSTGLKYDNKFCWVTRWNTDGVIVQVRAYLDSALVYKAITENESGEHSYADQRAMLDPGPVGINCAPNS